MPGMTRAALASARARWMLAIALSGAVAALAAGCGDTATSTAPPAAANSMPGVVRARAQVAQLEGPTTSYPAPGPPVAGVKSLRGKTVFYVPVSLSLPVFSIANNALNRALDELGIHERACSSDANPSTTAACVDRAVASNAAAIITDAVPIVLAANAFANAEEHHIPVLVVNQNPPPPGVPGRVHGIGNDELAYALLQGDAQVSAEAAWAIEDSHGSADVLLMPFTDTPSTLQYAQSALGTFHRDCPACRVSMQKISLANLELVPTQTSAALLRDRGTQYVLPEFDAALQGVGQGIQEAGFGDRLKVGTSGGNLPALEQIKAGRLAADLGEDFPYEGWADADEIVRMMLHMPVVDERVPLRLFTAANVGSLSLTPAAQASGAWYGNSGYTGMFERLWGLKDRSPRTRSNHGA